MNLSVYLESLGCAKNLVDSEMMLGVLRRQNFEIVTTPEQAQVIIVNTCGFIDSAKEEAINTILELSGYKTAGSCQYLLVCGCLVQRYEQELPELLPEVDAFLNVSEYHHIAAAIERLQGHDNAAPTSLAACYLERQLLTPKGSAYLKISEGCSNNCTYCMIPQIRGSRRSRPLEELLAEAKILAEQGVLELNIIAQDTTAYGGDLYDFDALPVLLKKLCELPFVWIRLLYCYPTEITDELLAVMAENKQICRYFDLPLQHISDKVLKDMNRRGNQEFITERIAKIREYLPDVALRTTFMLGFPGENEDDFRELLAYCQQTKFHWAGAFTFSPQQETVAAALPQQVPEQTAERRYDTLMQSLADLSANNLKKYIGQTLTVLIEEALNPQNGGGLYIGRSQYHAPDVDGVVYVRGEGLVCGQMVEVLIETAGVYDIVGRVV